MTSIEKLILENLLLNEEYSRKVVPFLKEDFFHDKKERIVFTEIKKFILAYNGLPTEKSLGISLSDRKDLTNDEFNDTVKLIETLKTKSQTWTGW